MVSIVFDLGVGFAVYYWFSAHSVLPGVLLRFPHFVISNSSLRLWVLPIPWLGEYVIRVFGSNRRRFAWASHRIYSQGEDIGSIRLPHSVE